MFEAESDAIPPPPGDAPADIDGDAAFRVCLLHDMFHQQAATYWGYDEITSWVVSYKEKIHINSGGALFGDMNRKGLGWLYLLTWLLLMMTLAVTPLLILELSMRMEKVNLRLSSLKS